jgi:hypothetical protein
VFRIAERRPGTNGTLLGVVAGASIEASGARRIGMQNAGADGRIALMAASLPQYGHALLDRSGLM